MAASEVDCERLDVTVLVVDDDTTTLSIIANILRSFEYKVATATNGHEALATLREFRGFFDIVITDLNMRGMNGFELQKRVKREFKLPVIIMSADSRKSVISKSLEHGAAFYLVKPVRREDLKDIWQYAVAGRREKLSVENDQIISISEGGDSLSPDEKDICSQDSAVIGKQPKQRKKYGSSKRKGCEVINEDLTYSGTKRSKIVWTTSLHNRFLLALRHIGMNKAVPKKILEIMNVPGLTRENVASHLQKYRIFLRKVAEKGIFEGLSERALRSRFAMGLPTALIRDIQKRVGRFRLHEHHYQLPYSTISRPQLPSPQPRHNPPTTRPSLTNQARLGQPNHYGTIHSYRNFQQLQYHGQANHHQQQQQQLNYRPVLPAYNGNGGFMTSANALTSNGIMSNYGSLGNSSNFNYGTTNYNNDINDHGSMIVPYGSSGLQRSPNTYCNQPGTQLNNNASLMVGTMNQGQNVGYVGHNSNFNYYTGGHSNNRFGLISNGSASSNAIVPVPSSVNNVRVQPTRGNIPGFPSLTQQSINGIGNAGGGGHNQHDTVTSMVQSGAGQFDDLNELFLLIDDMYLLDKPAESPRAGERSNSDILNSFNVEDCLELGDGEQVNPHPRESSINVLPNKSSSGTNENPNSVLSNIVSTNLEPLDMHMADNANSPAGNSAPQEQDWDLDLIETLFGAAADPS